MKCNTRRNANSLYVVSNDTVLRNSHGEVCGKEWRVVYWAKCVTHYSKSPQGVTGNILDNLPTNEATHDYQVAFIEPCANKCIDLCNTDIREGMYAWLANKPYKILAVQLFDDCNCVTIKLILERLEPRESHKSMLKCISCFDCEVKK